MQRTRSTNIRTRRNAFTLIELLVVIAIISLLAAILFPVFGKARDRARQTSCASNLKQIYTALRMYNQDFDGKYPAKAALGNAAYRAIADPFSMPYIINPYTKSDQLWYCPSQYTPHREKGYPGYWWISNEDWLDAPDVTEDGSKGGATLPQYLLTDNYTYEIPANFGQFGTTGQKLWPSKGKYCAHVSNTNVNYLGFDGRVKLFPWDWANRPGYCGK